MKVFKIIVCGLLVGVLSILVLEIASMKGVQIESLFYWALVAIGLVLGGFLGRYISWGWLLGGFVGFLGGFYGLLLLLAVLWPDRSYEDGLGWLFISAGVGLLVGGYTFSKAIKACTDV